MEKKNERDEFLVFCGKKVGEMARGDVEDDMAPTDEIQDVDGPT